MNQALYEEARSVLPYYPLHVTSLRLLQGEGDKKALWHISSSQGEFVLKRSHYPLDRILFSIYGQLYILERGAKVPPILKTTDGLPYVNKHGTIYIMYTWFPNARNPDFSQNEDLKQTLITLAKFHRTLEGYVPPVQCYEKWRIGKGVRGYEKTINQMMQIYKEFKKDKSNNKPIVVDYFPTIIDESKQIVNQLQLARFDEAIYNVRKRRRLTHEDFGEPNALIVKQQGYVIDIDGLAYNLPSRELARIILKGIRKQGFKTSSVQQIIDWYGQENPFSRQELEIMLLEMSFPNQFLRLLNSDIRNGNISARDYAKVFEFEEKKRHLLAKIQL